MPANNVIRVSPKTKAFLLKLKLAKRDSFDDVLQRLIKRFRELNG